MTSITLQSEHKRLISAKVGMMFFLATEAMFFAALMAAFFVFKSRVDVWPPIGQPRFSTLVTSINTLVLLVSAVTYYYSAANLKKSNIKWATNLFLATIILGGIFFAVQGYEWVGILNYGMNHQGDLYYSTFYILVGTHGLHVLAGLMYLVFVYLGLRQAPEDFANVVRVSSGSLYWYFVVFVWPVLYMMIYY